MGWHPARPDIKGGQDAMRVKLSPGEWNSRLHKQSPPARTNRKLKVLKPAKAGFACVAAVLTAHLRLS